MIKCKTDWTSNSKVRVCGSYRTVGFIYFGLSSYSMKPPVEESSLDFGLVSESGVQFSLDNSPRAHCSSCAFVWVFRSSLQYGQSDFCFMY